QSDYTSIFSLLSLLYFVFFFFFQAEDGIRDRNVTGVQTCALPIFVIIVQHLDNPSPHNDDNQNLRLHGRVFLYAFSLPLLSRNRSEERRVGKECRYRWWQDH